MAGSLECPCINSSDILSKLGVANCSSLDSSYLQRTFSRNDPCSTLTFGFCLAHDKDCDLSDYCEAQWCYVDYEKCRRSPHQMFRSNRFFEARLFYSYSTCNSSATLITDTNQPLLGVNLKVTVPASFYPYHFKRNAEGTVASLTGPEYYDDNLPFEGSLIDYLRAIKELARLDGYTYTFRSGGSLSAMHQPGSNSSTEFISGAVYDVQMGLSDFAITPFAVTSERLALTPFTTPIIIDQQVLWVQKPIKSSSFTFLANTTLHPFSHELWVLLVLSFVLVGCLNVWFANQKGPNSKWYRRFRGDKWKTASYLHRCVTLLYTLVDAIWATFIDFFGAATSSDVEVGLPHKILQFGFAALVLITIAAYTANLAAFLTRSQQDFYIDSVETAARNNVKICTASTFREILETTYPNAKFVYRDTLPTMFQAYDAGECGVLSLGKMIIRNDINALEEMCLRGLGFTSEVVLNSPIAFPAAESIVASLSHYITLGQENGIVFNTFQKRYQSSPSCVDLQIPTTVEANELEPLTPANMVLPFLLLGFCVALSVCTKLAIDIYRRRYSKIYSITKDRLFSSAKHEKNDEEYGQEFEGSENFPFPFENKHSLDMSAKGEDLDVRHLLKKVQETQAMILKAVQTKTSL